MATVSRGEITITNVDDGKPSYTHWAYKFADGRFTTTYPGENLLDNPYTTTGVSWDSQVPSAPENFEVGNNSLYTYLLRYGMGSLNEVLKTGDVITISFDIEMEVGTRINVYDSNSSQKYTIGSTNFTNIGTKKTRLSYTATVSENGKGGNRWILEFYNGNNGDKFSISKLKIEYGEIATPYTPSPLVDFDNAYPTYAGTYFDDQPIASTDPADYTWQRILGPSGEGGKDGDPAPLVSLSGATQAITVSKTGTVTPSSSFQVTGTAVNTTISTWTYSLNGGSFGSALPTGVTRSGNVVTVNPTTSTFNQLTIKADDGTVSDVFTISRITDGGDGNDGADAYTVFLTNESYTFAGSTSAALAGSTTTEVVVYKGINKITPTSVVVGTKPTGLSSSVSGSVVTFTAGTTLVTKSGTVPITITVEGETFTKQFAYALSFQGGKGDPGVSVTGTQVQYVQSSSMTEPTTGWSNTRPTPVPGQWLWTRSRSIFSDGTYGVWATVPTLIGREAIVISATAPSNPSTGTLWQTSSDPNVKQWDGANWIDWGIAPENIAADNLVVKDGRFDKLIGTELEGGVITNPFDYWNGEYVSGSNDQLWRRGQTIIEKSETTTMWEDYNKTTGVKIKEGGVVHNSDGVIVFVNDPSNYNQRASYTTSGIRLADSRGLGDLTSSFLTYNDLVTVNETLLTAASGFSQYSTTGENAPIASRTGRQVMITGAFKPNGAVTISADWVRVSTQLPIWARPRRTYQIRTQGTGMNALLVRVTVDGYIEISRYGKSDYVNLSGGEWLTIHMGYAGTDIF